ncbi:non-homologous end joining protein Ku [Puerhibacterium puerhi]|uniref:non-homologous end joining protein Ku n=1 Tax=Puerhibacterium puerhi TaxID=2692623 RepID=UPI00135B611F|nr:Ku protein [Puerhibacterium puerhi]
MRSIWKGAVSFGLVNVPVKLYSATEDHDVPLHQVHDADGGRIRYQRVCEIDGKTVPYEHIDRAYDDGEHTVVLTKDDLSALPAERDREIEVVEFVPSDQIDPIMLDRTYYLEPDSKSAKAYVLLRRTLEETERSAVVKFALRQRTRLAVLRVRGKTLVLQTLLWADEVREADFPSLEDDVTVSDRELAMSSQLVESFASDFSPEEFTDDYQVQLRQLIEAKIAKGESIDTAETFGEQPAEESAEVIDLMEALRKSVQEARSRKGGAADDGAQDGEKQGSSSKSASKSSSTSAKSSGSKSSSKSSGSKSSGSKSSASRSSSAKGSSSKDDASSSRRRTAARKTG